MPKYLVTYRGNEYVEILIDAPDEDTAGERGWIDGEIVSEYSADGPYDPISIVLQDDGEIDEDEEETP